MRSLYESLLDDFDTIVDNLDKDIIKKWCDDNLSGKYKITILKKAKSVRLYGDVIIKGISDEKIPFTIAVMDGTLCIEKCPNLKTLEGLFEEFMTVKGNLSINNCPKLISLKGCPFIVSGTFSLTGNSSLKSLEGAPEIVHGTTYVMKNGKKFSEDKIKEFIKMPTRIVCSNEDEGEIIKEEMINETLNEPHLLELVDQLKKNKTYNDYKRQLFGYHDIKWDELDSSNVKEFNKIDNDALKAARNIIAGNNGFILLKDYNGQYKSMINNDKSVLYFKKATFSYGLGPVFFNKQTSTDLISMVKNADSMVIVKWDDSSGESAVYKLRRDRRDSRDGMVFNTPEYYERVAEENIERYKKIIAKNRANGINVKEFEQIDSDVELIVQKALEFTRNLRKNSKDKNVTWDVLHIDSINRDIYDQRQYVGYSKGKSNYVGSDGLLYLYTEFTKFYMKFKESGDTYYENAMKRTKIELLMKIKDLKVDLGL